MRLWLILAVIGAAALTEARADFVADPGALLKAGKHGAEGVTPPPSSSHADATPHPTIAQPSTWPGLLVIGILALFVVAAAVGIAVRANTPEEIPVAHSHDEPPGASHQHGPAGNLDTGHRQSH